MDVVACSLVLKNQHFLVDRLQACAMFLAWESEEWELLTSFLQRRLTEWRTSCT